MRLRLAVCAVVVLTAAAIHAATFTVTSNADSGAGTFRWAIEQANATPGADQILFPPEMTVFPLSPLPPVTGQTFIAGNGHSLTIDGSNAGPNANGLVLQGDGCGVGEIVVRHFSGDGLVIASNNNFANVEATDNENGIRVAGTGNTIDAVSYTVQPHISANRSHGIWVTTNSDRTDIGHTSLYPPYSASSGLTGPLMSIAGNGGDGLRIDGNHCMVHVLVVSLNKGDGIRVNGDHNQLTDTRLYWSWVYNNAGNGISLFGNSNAVTAYTFKGNGGDGIFVAGGDNALIENESSVNEGNGMTLNADVLFESNFGACNKKRFIATSSDVQPPTITSSAKAQSVVMVAGVLQSFPNTRFRIDCVTSTAACPVAAEEPTNDLAALSGFHPVMVTTDAAGTASFTVAVNGGLTVDTVVAIATRLRADAEPAGGTSTESASFIVTPSIDPRADLQLRATAPASAYSGQRINIDYTLTNGGPFAAPYSFLFLGGAGVADPGVDCNSGPCYNDPLFPGETRTVRRVVVVRGSAGEMFRDGGSIEASMNDPDLSNNDAGVEVTVLPSATIPTLTPILIAALAAALGAIALRRLRP